MPHATPSLQTSLTELKTPQIPSITAKFPKRFCPKERKRNCCNWCKGLVQSGSHPRVLPLIKGHFVVSAKQRRSVHKALRLTHLHSTVKQPKWLNVVVATIYSHRHDQHAARWQSGPHVRIKLCLSQPHMRLVEAALCDLHSHWTERLLYSLHLH